MEIHNVQELKAYFSKQRKYVEKLREIAQKQGNKEADAQLRDVWLRLKQGPIRALVLGVSSAGKSTLINALVGKIIVPEGKHTTSPIPVWTYCEEGADSFPDVQILKEKDGRFQAGNIARYGHIMDYCYTPAQAGQGTGQARFKKVVAATVNVESGLVGDAGITLVDTPGIGVSQGDNDRVKEILKDSCELLIIVFMNLQQDDVKAYFRALLVEENAPLRSLLENNRVFMVLNNIHAATLLAKQDALKHIQDAFDGWGCEERLFTMNVNDARLKTCGVYPYLDLLPKEYLPDDRTWAIETMKKEKERIQVAKEQKEMEALQAALLDEVESIFEMPEEVEEILHPIQSKIDNAVALLKKPLEDRRKQIENTLYPVPPELEQKATMLQKRYDALMQYQSEIHKHLASGLDYSRKQFPLNELANKLLSDKKMQAYHLLANTQTEADSYLVRELPKPNGVETVAIKVMRRFTERSSILEKLVGMEENNPEIQYWADVFTKMQGMLSQGDLDRPLISREKSEALQQATLRALANARRAGQRALSQSTCFQLTQTEYESLKEYLKDKQEKLNKGGLVTSWNKFWLYPNVSVDKLKPLLEGVVRSGVVVYMSAFRDSLWQHHMEELFNEYKSLLRRAIAILNSLKANAEEDIRKHGENAKAAELEKVDAELKAMDFNTDIERKAV